MRPLLKELAIRLADKEAIDTLLDQCCVQILDSVRWYDTSVLQNAKHVVWEVKYLSLRGLLVRHPLIPQLVRLKNEED